MKKMSKTQAYYAWINTILFKNAPDIGPETHGFEAALRNRRNGIPVRNRILRRFEQDTPINPIEEAAFRFILKNPEFMEMFMDLADKARAAGHDQYQAATIVGILRYNHDVLGELQIDNDPDEEFFLNNNHIRTFARLYNELRLPDPPLFEIRQRQE